MKFHRYYFPGQVVFITQTVDQRKKLLVDSTTVELLYETLRRVKEIHPFTMLDYVILPDHLHLLIQPDGDSNFSQIMHSLKSNFTHNYKSIFGIDDNVNFWQKRFWDHVIRDEIDLENHIHYIHINPQKHGNIEDPFKWKHSSIHEWQKRGAYGDEITWEESKGSSWGE